MPVALLTSHPSLFLLKWVAELEGMHTVGWCSAAPWPCGAVTRPHSFAQDWIGSWLPAVSRRRKMGNKTSLCLPVSPTTPAHLWKIDSQKNILQLFQYLILLLELLVLSHGNQCCWSTAVKEWMSKMSWTSPNGWNCLPSSVRIDIKGDFQFAECHILSGYQILQEKTCHVEASSFEDIVHILPNTKNKFPGFVRISHLCWQKDKYRQEHSRLVKCQFYL